jgi:excisionase family DNA binding protein
MPQTKAKPEPAPEPASPPSTGGNGPTAEVLTLAEAAAYLRLPETDVLRFVEEQDLPARQVDKEWRVLKGAIQTWLSTPVARSAKQGIWAAAGSLKNDPYLEEMLQEIDRMRGRPGPEER